MHIAFSKLTHSRLGIPLLLAPWLACAAACSEPPKDTGTGGEGGEGGAGGALKFAG